MWRRVWASHCHNCTLCTRVIFESGHTCANGSLLFVMSISFAVLLLQKPQPASTSFAWPIIIHDDMVMPLNLNWHIIVKSPSSISLPLRLSYAPLLNCIKTSISFRANISSSSVFHDFITTIASHTHTQTAHHSIAILHVLFFFLCFLAVVCATWEDGKSFQAKHKKIA